jgi:hypothetical protein
MDIEIAQEIKRLTSFCELTLTMIFSYDSSRCQEMVQRLNSQQKYMHIYKHSSYLSIRIWRYGRVSTSIWHTTGYCFRGRLDKMSFPTDGFITALALA